MSGSTAKVDDIRHRSRRDFLRQSALVGGGALLPGSTFLSPQDGGTSSRRQEIDSTGYAARDASGGAEVYAFTTTEDKVEDIRAFGASEAVVVDSPESLQPYHNALDYVISTIPAAYELGAYLPLVRSHGTYTQVGLPAEPLSFNQGVFIFNRVQYEGSLTGGIPQTQALVDYCAEHDVLPEIEVIRADEVNDAWESVLETEARYRYVIDAGTI